MMDYQTQLELEELFNKNQLISRLKKEYDIPEIRDYCNEKEIPIKFALDLLTHIMIHKRANVPTLVGILNHHCVSKQACADLLLRCAEVDLIDWDDEREEFIVRIQVMDSIMNEISKFMYPLPMVVEPEEIKDNRTTGYLSDPCKNGSIILKDNHHDDDVCLDHINRMNQIPLSLNAQVAHFINNKWKNIDKQKASETFSEYLTRRKAFEKYTETTKDVVDAFIVMGNKLFMTHRYDKRGRTYCNGYHINPQGNDWNKSTIEFFDKELVT